MVGLLVLQPKLFKSTIMQKNACINILCKHNLALYSWTPPFELPKKNMFWTLFLISKKRFNFLHDGRKDEILEANLSFPLKILFHIRRTRTSFNDKIGRFSWEHVKICEQQNDPTLTWNDLAVHLPDNNTLWEIKISGVLLLLPFFLSPLPGGNPIK